VTVLVTGAGGYVGSHACKALPAAGLQPIGLDNFERAGLSRLPWGPLEMNDTRDRSALDDVLSRHRPDAAMHCAAYAYVGESVTRPDSYHRNSALGKLTLLEALRDAGIAQAGLLQHLCHLRNS